MERDAYGRSEHGTGSPLQGADTENLLPFRDLLGIIRRRLWVILTVTTLLVAAAVGISFLLTPKYEASTRILVGQKQGTANSYSLGSDVQGLQQLTQTLATVASGRPIAEAVIEQQKLSVDPETFQDRLDVQQIPETQVVQIAYEDSDPERARRIANALGDVFSERISEVSPEASGVTATVYERAALPAEPTSPNIPLNVLLALALGLVLGTVLTLLLDYLDDSWRSSEEVEQFTGVPTFGMIPEFEVPKGKRY